MQTRSALGPTDENGILFAILLLRVGSLIGIILTLPARDSMPAWMLDWFQRISYPLLFINVAFLALFRGIARLLLRHPSLVFTDLAVASGILMIGGGWRSSYFEYTLTTIMLLTLFRGKAGAYLSSGFLSAVSLFKDPTGGFSSLESFDVGAWDMRLGAALFYVTAGLIFGYFRTLVDRLNADAQEKVAETRIRVAMEEKNRLALNLHDGAKQMVNAILLRMHPLILSKQPERDATAEELRWLWRSLNYVKNDLQQVMDMLRRSDPFGVRVCDIASLVREEKGIAEVMTGFMWQTTIEPATVPASGFRELALRRFLSEALMNAWKHSGATAGSLSVRADGRTVTVTVSDAGKGFIDTAGDGPRTTGLTSMKQRAKDLGGALDIETTPGNGCRLTLSFPYTEGKADGQK